MASIFTLFIEHWKRSSDKRKEKKKKKQEGEVKITYYIFLLEDIISKSEEQIQHLNKYIVEQQQDLLNLNPIKLVPIENLFIQNQNLKRDDTFEALFSKFQYDSKWIKQYNELNSAIDFLHAQFCEALLRISREITIRYTKDIFYIRDLIFQFHDILLRQITLLSKNQSKSEELIFLEETFANYLELLEKKASVDDINTQFLLPLLKKSGNLPQYSCINELMFHCKEISLKISCIKLDVKDTIRSYSMILDSINAPIEKIREILFLIKN